jgi:hypothetical protein
MQICSFVIFKSVIINVTYNSAKNAMGRTCSADEDNDKIICIFVAEISWLSEGKV